VVQLASDATQPQQANHFQGTEQAADALPIIIIIIVIFYFSKHSYKQE